MHWLNTIFLALSLILASCAGNGKSVNNIPKEQDLLEKKDNDGADSLISQLKSRYNNAIFFDSLILKDYALITEIKRIFNNNNYNEYVQGINYYEKNLDTNLYLIRFILPEETEYSFLINNGKMIWRTVTPVQHAKLAFVYTKKTIKNLPTLTMEYEQCEAGCENFTITEKIFELGEDTVRLKISRPVERVMCVNSIGTKIAYSYRIVNTQMMIEKKYVKLDCLSSRIIKTDSVVNANILLKKYENVYHDDE